MHRSSLILENWKCFDHKELFFDEDQCLIVGHNGAGKTSILQALYFLHHLRMPGGPTWKEAIAQGQTYSNITLRGGPSGAMRAYLDLEKGVIRLFIGEKSVTRKVWRDNLAHLPIYVESMSLNILYLSPSLRRDFLDEMIMTSDESYTKLLRDYRHILTQRNKLLGAIKDGKSSRSELPFWDEKLIGFAVSIYQKRKEIVDNLIHNIGLSEILGDEYVIHFEYISKLDIGGDIADQMMHYFAQNRDKEILLSRTLRGPHLDDWTLLVGEGDQTHESTHFLSRGENKMLFLELVKILTDWIQSNTQKTLLYLLDDIFAELDENNADKLSHSIGKHFIVSSQKEREQDNCFVLKI